MYAFLTIYTYKPGSALLSIVLLSLQYLDLASATKNTYP